MILSKVFQEESLFHSTGFQITNLEQATWNIFIQFDLY